MIGEDAIVFLERFYSPTKAYQLIKEAAKEVRSTPEYKVTTIYKKTVLDTQIPAGVLRSLMPPPLPLEEELVEEKPKVKDKLPIQESVRYNTRQVFGVRGGYERHVDIHVMIESIYTTEELEDLGMSHDVVKEAMVNDTFWKEIGAENFVLKGEEEDVQIMSTERGTKVTVIYDDQDGKKRYDSWTKTVETEPTKALLKEFGEDVAYSIVWGGRKNFV